MLKKLDTYAAIAQEMEKIMQDNFGDKYSNDILGSYVLTCSDEKRLDELVASYGVRVTSDGYDISKNGEAINKIALGEINKQMQQRTPSEYEAHKIMSRIDSEVANVENTIAQYNEDRLPELYDDIIRKLDNVHDIYFANKEKLGMSEEKYHDVIDRIENIKKQVEELANDLDEHAYEQEEKEGSLLKELKKVSPTFKQEHSSDERELD